MGNGAYDLSFKLPSWFFMSFSKVIVINMNISGIKSAPYSQLSQSLNKPGICKQPADVSRKLLFLKEDLDGDKSIAWLR